MWQWILLRPPRLLTTPLPPGLFCFYPFVILLFLPLPLWSRCGWVGESRSSQTVHLPCSAKRPESSGRARAKGCSPRATASLHKPAGRRRTTFNHNRLKTFNQNQNPTFNLLYTERGEETSCVNQNITWPQLSEAKEWPQKVPLMCTMFCHTLCISSVSWWRLTEWETAKIMALPSEPSR